MPHTEAATGHSCNTVSTLACVCVYMSVLMWSVGNFNEFTCVMRRVVCRRRRVSCVSHVLPHCSCPFLLHTHTHTHTLCLLLPVVCRLLVLIVLIFYTKLLVSAYMQQLQKLLFFILFYASPFSLSNRNFCSLTEYIVVAVVVLLSCSSIANWVNKFVTDTHN